MFMFFFNKYVFIITKLNVLISSIPTTGNVPEGRTWHSLSAASDKHLFLYGGFNNMEEVLSEI